MWYNHSNIILYIIRDVEIYLCIFLILSLLTIKRIRKLIKSNFLQDDELFNKLSKTFYPTEVKVAYNPFKCIIKSALYHIYYFTTILNLIYLFRFYVCYKKFIHDYLFSFSFLKICISILDEFDFYLFNYGVRRSFIFIFIFGNCISLLFYKIVYFFLKRRKKYIIVKRVNVLNYCLELAKIDFKEYVKSKKKKKKGSRFKFVLNNSKDFYYYGYDNNYEKYSKNIEEETNNYNKKGIIRKRKRNLFSYIINTFLLNKHVLHNEKLLYDNSIKDKENVINTYKKFPLTILKSLFHFIKKVKDVNVEKNNSDKNNLEEKKNTSNNSELINFKNSYVNKKEEDENKKKENENKKEEDENKKKENENKKEKNENKNINTSNKVDKIMEEVTSKYNISNLHNNTEIEEKINEDSQFNNIYLCELKLMYCNVYVCNSHYQYKNIIDILILHLPIYFFFKNKMFVKTSFTLVLYLLNFIIWNFTKLLSMIKPSILIYYYILNEHISQILSENLNEFEKKVMLHFFYGFFFCSLIYLKYYIDIEFKLIKLEHMDYFQKIINDCLNKAFKLKSQKIIKNYEDMKIFPLCIDHKKKNIYINKSLLKTNKELEELKQKKKLKNEKNYLQSIYQIVKFCDEDFSKELLTKIKNIILKELPEKLANNLCQKVSDEIYQKILNKESFLLNKDTPNSIYSSMKRNILCEIFEETKNNESNNTDVKSSNEKIQEDKPISEAIKEIHR
ncbi:conserved Plasmodium protein, unknown function [Plasmodium gallinaceum]|uniref:Uncharacterized protein n=1 Tax=Plasmodium gallinaceum TaxID=5849 RepID=A0A1J1H367_PLAGA|nr:conserved Plasmodium protein, unknown function [Plasmodium gallinaceum]CRG97782.1 conserved Plasmodium protein, unknown function [Plasmodium gallinaceum]